MILLSAGDEPRRALRYTFHPDTKERAAMDMRLSLAMTIDGNHPPTVTMPPVKMHCSLVPERTTPEGNLVYRLALESIDVAPGAADPRFQGAIEAAMKKLVGMAGEAEWTTRGKIVRATMTVPPEAGDAASDVLEQLEHAMRDLAVPLPEEPVGRGAKWTATTPFHMSMLDATRTATFTLSRVEGDHGTMDVTVAMTAPPQPIHSRKLRGATVNLETLGASGQGRIQFDLQRLVPPSSDADIHIDVVTSVDAPDAKHTVKMATDIGLHMAPEAR